MQSLDSTDELEKYELEQDKYSQKRGPDELEQDGMEDKPQNYLIAEEQFVIDVLKKRLEEEEGC